MSVAATRILSGYSDHTAETSAMIAGESSSRAYRNTSPADVAIMAPGTTAGFALGVTSGECIITRGYETSRNAELGSDFIGNPANNLAVPQHASLVPHGRK